jgi:hypothetical protein
MALDKNTLAEAIRTAFESAKEEEWTVAQVAEALASAIDAFVKSGDVVDVVVEVKDVGNNVIGTGVQVEPFGKVQ